VGARRALHGSRWMCLSVEDGCSGGSKEERRRAFQQRYFTYIFSVEKEKHAYGVIVISLHLWGCGVVTEGWHLEHRIVVAAVHQGWKTRGGLEAGGRHDSGSPP